MKKNFKEIGTWWNDSNIDLIEIDGTVYALNGWNGDEFTNCWKCLGEYYTDASKERYTVRPQYREIKEDEFEIVAYEVV